MNIKKVDSYLNSIGTLSIEDISKEVIAVNKAFHISFNKTSGILTIRLKIDFHCRHESSSPLALFGGVIQFDYGLMDFEEVIKEQDSNVLIPNDLIINLLSISFSTSRGILAAFTAGTDYNNFFFPLIDTSEFKRALNQTEIHKTP